MNVLRLHGRSAFALMVVTLIGAAAFTWPFFGGLSSTNAGGWIYVLDGIVDVPGPLRLRTFDATGIERASRTDIGTVASTHRALAIAIGT